MVSHLFYYQLALLALMWLFVMLHRHWSKPGLPTPPMPSKPKRKRSTEPKAFEGLTHKPHCALCEQETADTNPPPPVPPDPMPLDEPPPPYRGHLEALLSPQPIVTIAAGWG